MKILTLGYFGYHNGQLDGQTVKTRNVYELLEQHIGGTKYFDTQRFKYNKLSIFAMLYQFCKADKVIYVAARGNLKYIFPILYILSKIFKVEISYVQIGGWLQAYLKTKPMHVYMLKHIKNVFAELPLTKKVLEEEFHLTNVSFLSNFRNTKFKPNITQPSVPLKCVFFARVMKLKGVDMIFDLAEYICQNKLNITIDFYGQINKEDEDYFNTNIAKYSFCNYKGALQPSEVNSTLQNYDVLILPTHFLKGEGFPGSILDAYISGIPVIVSNFMHAHDFVEEGLSGYIIEDYDKEALIDNVTLLANNPDKLYEMKQYAAKKSHEYSADIAWNTIWEKAIR